MKITAFFTMLGIGLSFLSGISYGQEYPSGLTEKLLSETFWEKATDDSVSELLSKEKYSMFIDWTELLRLALQNPNQSPLVVGRLIKQGADVNAKGVNGQTPLMLASQIAANPDVIDQLVRLVERFQISIAM